MSCSHEILAGEIRVKSDILRSLFALNDLASLKLRTSNNCCSEKTTSFKFCKPSESCNYRIRYCTDYASFLDDRATANKIITLGVSHFCDEGIIISGFVKNLQGVTIPGCPIDIWYDGEIESVVSDGNGDYYFVIPDITNGVYNIEIRAPLADSVRNSYAITDCIGDTIHSPASFEYICDDAFFTKTNSLVFTISGVDKNILRKEYNFLESSQRDKFVDDVNNWFSSNCTGASICFDYEEDTEAVSACYDFQIKNLPNHIVPKNITLYGSGTCISVPEFTCTNGDSVDLCVDDDAVKCGTFVGRVAMIPGIYRFLFMKLKNLTCVEHWVYFADGDMPYTEHHEGGPGGTNLENIREKIQDWLEAQELTGTVNVSITNSVLEIKITGMSFGSSPMYLFYDDHNDGQRKQVEFTCTDYDYSIADCEWTVRVETEAKCGPIEIGLITKNIVGTNVPEVLTTLNISGRTYQDADTGDYISGKIAEYFPGSFVTFSRVDGYSEDSILVFRVNHSADRPQSIISFDVNGKPIENLFACTNLYHACECEEGTNENVGFTEDEFILYPEMFGKTSFDYGVYSLQICYKTFSGLEYKESICIFYESKEILCLVSDAVAIKKDTIAVSLYEALKNYSACEDCDCASMCEMYEVFVDELNSIFKKRVLNGCGCK